MNLMAKLRLKPVVRQVIWGMTLIFSSPGNLQSAFLRDLRNNQACNKVISSGAAAPELLQHFYSQKDRQSKFDPKHIYAKACAVVSVST